MQENIYGTCICFFMYHLRRLKDKVVAKMMYVASERPILHRLLLLNP